MRGSCSYVHFLYRKVRHVSKLISGSIEQYPDGSKDPEKLVSVLREITFLVCFLPCFVLDL